MSLVGIGFTGVFIATVLYVGKRYLDLRREVQKRKSEESGQ